VPRDCHKKVNARAEKYQLSRAEFFLLVVLVELVFVLFAETFRFVFFETAGSQWFDCLQLSDVFELDAAFGEDSEVF
jgi:hypothetical protein